MTFTETLQAVLSFIIQVFVIFPYSALTIQRQRQLPQPARLAAIVARDDLPTSPGKAKGLKETNLAMLSEAVYNVCRNPESVSTVLGKDPTIAPADAWKKLYGGHAAGERGGDSKAINKAGHYEYTAEDLKRAEECGNWGPIKPSDLFLKMYYDALCTLDKGFSGAMVSPSLMGSCGTIPLTVISVVPDIMRHMSNLIVRADKEVYLATNYWQNSVASKYITNAMIELSKRAGQRGAKIVFKLIYDRGSPKQLLEPHLIVSEKDYLGNAVNLPKPEDIPNLDLEVMNYHKPMLGTFHCKYMIVDRKIAVLQSNNIQDNDNMEMMTHLEGPIVDSLYDMALISWSKAFDPPLPSHNSPAVKGGLGSFGSKSHSEIFSNNGTINGHPAIIHADGMKKVTAYSYENQKIQQPGIVPNGSTKASTDSSRADFLTGPTTDESVLHPARTIEENQANGLTRATSDQELWDKPYTQIGRRLVESGMEVTESNVDLVDSNKGKTSADKPASEQAIANGKVPTGPDAKAAEFFGSGEQTLPESQIEHPSSLESLLPEHTTQEPHYDVDIASEVARVQTAVSPRPGETRVEAVCHHLNHTKNPDFKPTAPECAPHDEMTPYIPHPVHEPFPIAMVNREPYGTPNHGSVYTPQNEAWLSALRNAEKNVFIQSPTLNAEPLIPAIIEACERGIDVYCYICLGYNDTGELLPMQGGTNEMIAHKLFTHLSDSGKERLHYFWYIGKDQTVPIVAKKKKRGCHVKVMIVDEHIGIQGNGNQDTQSWFHSQEINIMFDSELICKAWIDGLRRNQNTHLYGQLDKADGVWRDANGEQALDVIGVDPGRFSWAKGFMGAINRVRGTGDF